jgi:hypothetical protein
MPDSTGAPAPVTNISADQATSTRLRSVPSISEGGRSIQRATPPAHRFTRISNQWVRDRRLSWKARGVLTWLTSHAAGFKVSEKTIICAAPDGRDAIRAAIRELETYGYLLRERERGRNGTLGGVDYILCDPWSPQLETPQLETRQSIPAKGAVPASPAPENPPLATTSENTEKPQVTTYDGKTNGGKSTPIRRTDK